MKKLALHASLYISENYSLIFIFNKCLGILIFINIYAYHIFHEIRHFSFKERQQCICSTCLHHNTIPNIGNADLYMKVMKHIQKHIYLIYNSTWQSKYKVIIYIYIYIDIYILWSPSWYLHSWGDCWSPSLFTTTLKTQKLTACAW